MPPIAAARCAAILLLPGAAAMAVAQGRIQPFSAHQSLTDHRNGAHAVRVLARRSDGARVTVDSILLGKSDYALDGPAYSRELVMPDGQSLRLVDALRAKSTWPRIPSAEIADTLRSFGNPAPDCGAAQGQARILGRDIVEGLEALVTQEIDRNGLKTMQWVVPALGCAAVKSIIQQTPPNGPPVVVFETTLDRITLGEPEEKLFFMGADYTEMRPSRAIVLQQTALQIDVQDRGGAALDRKYSGR